MTANPRDAFRGALTVATRDLRSNARGLKVWLISGLTLLVIVASAFGIGAVVTQAPPITAQVVLWANPYWPTANNTTAGVEVWVSDYLGAPHAGYNVVLGNPYPASLQNKTFVARTTLPTNATGWARFPDLGPGFWPVNITVGAFHIEDVVPIGGTAPVVNLNLAWKRVEILGDGAARDVGFQAVWSNGTPVAKATVLLNGDPVDVTDANGFYYHRFPDGSWTVRIAASGAYTTTDLEVATSPLAIFPLLKGPDPLLLFLGVELMNLFAPIIAIVMSYDAVAKERMQGSLELLLAHPGSRAGIAVGKFVGSFLSVSLPMLGILLGALVGVEAVTGRWPDAPFTAAIVVGTMGLIAIYVLIMQIFSTLARSPGTAILSAFVVWFVFNIVWSLVFVGVETAFHVEGGTPAAFTLSAITSLFNPNQVYSLFITTFMPPSVLGLFGTTSGSELPDWAGPVAMLVWIAVLLALAVYVFRKRIV